MGTRVEHINKQNWLELSNKLDGKEVRRYAVDSANREMYELLRPAEGGDIGLEELQTAIHVAYAWMPTMLWKEGSKLVNETSRVEFRTEYCERFNRFVKKAKNETPSDKAIEYLMKYTNNSVVGLSKVLHIFDPVNFPIWDSKVAKTFFILKSDSPQVGSKVNWYLTWLETSRKWAKDRAVLDRIKVLRKDYKCLEELESLRVVELVVFCSPYFWAYE